MSKTIHIHIHRAPAKDAWEESKHKRAANGQFGSGGGGAAAKPAAKSAPAAAKKSFEQQVKETRMKQLAAAARKSLGIKEPGAKPAAPAGPKSFEQQVKETRMKQLAAAGAKSLGVKPAAPKADNPQNVATQLAARKNQLKELQAEMKTGKYSPEDVAELKNKEASLKRMIANYESKSAAPKTDWSKSNGDWTAAKKEGAEMFERALSSAKTGGDRTDAALKLKAEAAEQQKNGSYLGAVVLGLVNDYFDRLK